ncbi:MAG: hypothetical protein WAW61_16460 [Methylococcaceae bacterium]
MNEKSVIKRRLYTHNQLLGAAAALSKEANGEGEFNNAMACALFCALALEAALNYIGGTIFPLWDDHLQTKLSPEGKLALIADHAQYEIKFGEAPFQAFRAVFELRNQLVHGKMQDLSYKTAKHWLVYGKHRWPAAQWETLCTAKAARSLLEDTKQMIAVLHRVCGVEAVPSFLLSEPVAHAQQ